MQMQNAKCRINGEAPLPIIDSVDVWFYLPSKAGGPPFYLVVFWIYFQASQ